MSNLTNYAEKAALDFLFGGDVFAQLHVGDPGEDGTANPVTVGMDADIVRKAVTMGATTLGTGKSVNTTSVSWTVDAASAGYTVTHISLWDALAAGNSLFKGEFLSPEELVANDILTLAAGIIVAELD